MSNATPMDSKDAQIAEHVFMALGEASMCWEGTPTGVFDSDRAKKIGDDLIEYIHSLISESAPKQGDKQ